MIAHCYTHLNSELLQAARHAPCSCSCLNSCLVHCSVMPAPWLLSRRSPPGSSHLPSWQFDTNKSLKNGFCLHALSTAIQNASWNLSICTSLTGDFYTFRDTEYIANDYLLKATNFCTLNLLDRKYKVNFFTSLTNNPIPFLPWFFWNLNFIFNSIQLVFILLQKCDCSILE